MTRWVLAVLLLALAVGGSSLWACPPPSAPDYDGEEVGGGPPDDPGNDKDNWGWGDGEGGGKDHDVLPPRDPDTKPGHGKK